MIVDNHLLHLHLFWWFSYFPNKKGTERGMINNTSIQATRVRINSMASHATQKERTSSTEKMGWYQSSSTQSLTGALGMGEWSLRTIDNRPSNLPSLRSTEWEVRNQTYSKPPTVANLNPTPPPDDEIETHIIAISSRGILYAHSILKNPCRHISYVLNMLFVFSVWCILVNLQFPPFRFLEKRGLRKQATRPSVRPIWTIPVWRRSFSSSSTRPWRLMGQFQQSSKPRLADDWKYCIGMCILIHIGRRGIKRTLCIYIYIYICIYIYIYI